MLMRVELILANPAWRRINGDRACFTTAFVPASAGATAIHEHEDGVTVAVCQATGVVELFRSITTSDQLYHVVHDGVLTITDSFSTAVAALPSERRTVPDTAIVDHFLFRTTPGIGTYIAEVSRVGNGEHVQWTGGEAAPVTHQRARLNRPGSYMSEAHALDRLDQALQEAVPPLDGAVNLLSGGVDSTLLQSYLTNASVSVSATIDSPEFGMEQGYAQAAARLFGLDHRLAHVREADYARRLEALVARSGLPPHHLQTVLIDAAVSSGGPAYVTAQFADALFGLDSALRAWRIDRLRLARLRPVIAAMALMPWGRLRRFRSTLDRDLALTRTDITDPAGFAMLFATYTDLDAAVRLFGSDLVRDRLRARYAYVAERVDMHDARASRVMQHLETGQWIDFFCDDTVSIWRQVALSHGVRLDAPFSRRSVVEAALGLDPSVRFCAGGRTKPLLKRLLRRRVPTYPATQPKGGSGLPVVRYLESGPLSELADDALTGDWPVRLRDTGEGPSPWMLWNQLTLRMWDRTMRRAQVLDPGSRSTVLRFAEPL
jgi:hypothetical protein